MSATRSTSVATVERNASASPELLRLAELERALIDAESTRLYKKYQLAAARHQELQSAPGKDARIVMEAKSTMDRALATWQANKIESAQLQRAENTNASERPEPRAIPTEIEPSFLNTLDALIASRATPPPKQETPDRFAAEDPRVAEAIATLGSPDGTNGAILRALLNDPTLRERVEAELSQRIARFQGYPRTQAQYRERLSLLQAPEQLRKKFEDEPSVERSSHALLSPILAGLANPQYITPDALRALLNSPSLQAEVRASLTRRAQFFTAPANKAMVETQTRHLEDLNAFLASAKRKKEIRLEEILARVVTRGKEPGSATSLRAEIAEIGNILQERTTPISEPYEALDLGDGLVVPISETAKRTRRVERPMEAPVRAEVPRTIEPSGPTEAERAEQEARAAVLETFKTRKKQLQSETKKLEEAMRAYGDDVFDLANGLAEPRIPFAERARNFLRANTGQPPEPGSWKALIAEWTKKNDELQSIEIDLSNWKRAPQPTRRATPRVAARNADITRDLPPPQPMRERKSRVSEVGPKTSLPKKELTAQESAGFEHIRTQFNDVKSAFEAKFNEQTLKVADVDRTIMQIQNLDTQTLALLGDLPPYNEDVVQFKFQLQSILEHLQENRRYLERWEGVQSILRRAFAIQDRLQEQPTLAGADRLALAQDIVRLNRALNALPDHLETDETYNETYATARAEVKRAAMTLKERK